MNQFRTARIAALVGAAVLIVAACNTGGGGGGGGAPYDVGVSNTLQGNGWREQMICSINAEAKTSGKVAKVTTVNRNTDTAGQIEDMRTLISAGVDIIVLNPTSDTALNAVIKEATDKGITVVAVDQAVTEQSAYVLSNDQENYGYLGAKWLFEELGGTGKVVYMRGIDGVPADTARNTGFQRALAENPGIEIVKETFTGWDPTVGAQQIQDIFSSGIEFDGIWTSGIDIPIVEAFKQAGVTFVPIVGADNNKFVVVPRHGGGQRPRRRGRDQPAARRRRGPQPRLEGQGGYPDRSRGHADPRGLGQHHRRRQGEDQGCGRSRAERLLRGDVQHPRLVVLLEGRPHLLRGAGGLTPAQRNHQPWGGQWPPHGHMTDTND